MNKGMLLYEFYKLKERMMFKIAWMLPRWLVYFAAVRLISHATVGKYENQNVPRLTAMKALERWSSKEGKEW